jgi:hypothetical protein
VAWTASITEWFLRIHSDIESALVC